MEQLNNLANAVMALGVWWFLIFGLVGGITYSLSKALGRGCRAKWRQFCAHKAMKSS